MFSPYRPVLADRGVRKCFRTLPVGCFVTELLGVTSDKRAGSRYADSQGKRVDQAIIPCVKRFGITVAFGRCSQQEASLKHVRLVTRF